MRHKALPLPGQPHREAARLPLDFDATEEEPGGVEAGDLAANGRDRTPNCSDLVRMSSSLSGSVDEERDAVS